MSDKLAKVSLKESDARKLLTRAAELQSEKTIAHSGTLPLSEIERAGREAGIDVASLRRAAEELGYSSSESHVEAIRELDRAIVVERTATGTLGAHEEATLIAAARRELSVAGELERTEHGLIWRSGAGAPRQVTLFVERVGGETQIRLVQDIKDLHLGGVIAIAGAGSALSIAATLLAGVIAADVGQQILLSILFGGGTGLGFGMIFGTRLYRWYVRRAGLPYVESLQRLANALAVALDAPEDETPPALPAGE